MSQNLENAGFTIVPFGQGFKDMSPPTKELMKLVLEGRIAHGGNAPLRWMMDKDRHNERDGPYKKHNSFGKLPHRSTPASSHAIIEALFALIAAVITAIVIPYIRSKTTAQQQEELCAWVQIAVSAAEQIYTGQGRGAEKKEYVLSWLRNHGVTVDDSKLDALVEAAVYGLQGE